MLSKCKLHWVASKVYMSLIGIHSLCTQPNVVYTSINLRKMKFFPLLKAYKWHVYQYWTDARHPVPGLWIRSAQVRGGGGGGRGGGRATSLREWKHNNNVYQYDYTGAQTVEVMIYWTVQIFNALRRKVLLMSLMSIYKCEDSNRNCIRYDIRFIKATARIVFRKHV